MTCGHDDLLIDGFVDGTLDASVAADVTAHLDACARCRAMAADFRSLRELTGELEPFAPPARVWHTLSARTASRPGRASRHSGLHAPAGDRAPVAPGTSPTQSKTRGGRVTVGTQASPWLVRSLAGWQPAAAAAMSAVLATGLWWVADHLSLLVPAAPSAQVASEAASIEAQYVDAIAGLEPLVRVERDALDRETAAMLVEGMTVIDEAIDRSRTELAAQPENEAVRESLVHALRSKVKLLQDTLALVPEAGASLDAPRPETYQ